MTVPPRTLSCAGVHVLVFDSLMLLPFGNFGVVGGFLLLIIIKIFYLLFLPIDDATRRVGGRTGGLTVSDTLFFLLA